MRPHDTDSVARAFGEALRPPPATTVDEWAELRRYLPTETSANAGRWRNALTPWLVPIMQAMSPASPYQEIVFMSAARCGKTEGGLNNPVGFYMDMVRCPIMVAQPIEADAEEWSKDHLDPLIANTPSLAQLITPDKDRRKGNTILHKKYRGGVVYVVGANSPKSFRRRTIRVLLCDELDAWPGMLAGEGDPYSLAKERTATFPFSRKIIACSTPTIRNSSRIEMAFMSGTQSYWHVPCPECGLYQRLVFSRLHYDADVRDGEGRPVTEYLCDPEIGGCGALIPEYKRDGMVARGRMVATYPARRVLSFQISQLYAPWVRWSDLTAGYLEAHKDPLQLQVFTNTKLGETYDIADADSWDPDSLMRLRIPLEILPHRVSVLTAGCDVQADRIVVQVDGWGPGEERWTLDRVDILGDPTRDPNESSSVWAELDKMLSQLAYRHALGGELRIRATGIDTGGLATAQAYKFARARRNKRVWALKGDGGREGARLWPKVPSRKNKGNLPLYLVGVFAGKETCMSRLRSSSQALSRGETEGPGFWHFAARPALAESYFDELTAEVCVVDTARARGGRHTGERRRRWQLRRSDQKNEGLDCSVYSYAVLHGLYAQGLRLDKAARPMPVSTETIPPVVPDRRNGRNVAFSPKESPATQPTALPLAPTQGKKRPRWE